MTTTITAIPIMVEFSIGRVNARNGLPSEVEFILGVTRIRPINDQGGIVRNGQKSG